MFRSIFLFLLPLFFLLSGCDIKPKPIAGVKQIAIENERRTVKRIREQDILQAAQEAGDRIVAVAQQEMDRVVPARLQAEGVAGTLTYCRPEHYRSVDSLVAEFGGRAQRVSRRPRNQANQAQLPVSARLHDLENGPAPAGEPMLTGVVQRLSPTDLIYTKPILIRDAYCLRCHGVPGQELSKADNLLMKDAYPDDQATGYQLGEVRGMWLISFPQKGVVEYMTQLKLRAYQERREERLKNQ